MVIRLRSWAATVDERHDEPIERRPAKEIE
jgi:hypothetical protein